MMQHDCGLPNKIYTAGYGKEGSSRGNWLIRPAAKPSQYSINQYSAPCEVCSKHSLTHHWGTERVVYMLKSVVTPQTNASTHPGRPDAPLTAAPPVGAVASPSRRLEALQSLGWRQEPPSPREPPPKHPANPPHSAGARAPSAAKHPAGVSTPTAAGG